MHRFLARCGPLTLQRRLPGARSMFLDDRLLPPDMRDSYINGTCRQGIVVRGHIFPQSVLVHRDGVLHWAARGWADLSPESLAVLPLLHPHVDLLLIGSASTASCTGHTYFLPAVLKQWLREHCIHVEVLTPQLAASQFNTLLSEGRSVVAAMLAENLTDEDDTVPPRGVNTRVDDDTVSRSLHAGRDVLDFGPAPPHKR
ncbi:MAG: hypothetical protein MHM6MM_002042 [Cercozoa sp. M6MM]